MSNHWFRFKQFTIQQDRCAMKVGTDAVLLGAWCSVDGRRRILDVGTGTGIIALMTAQRNASAHITAIDIDRDSVVQATENVHSSPFADRVEVQEADFATYSPERPFDLIVSNPPFYEEEVFCPDGQRNSARHTSSLRFDVLISRADALLDSEGAFAVIIPTKETAGFISLCAETRLYLHRRTDIHTTPRRQPKRTMLEFTKIPKETIYTNLYMRDEDNSFSEEYLSLTKDFYLSFGSLHIDFHNDFNL